MAHIDGDPYQRYGGERGLVQVITEYTDRPSRRLIVDPRSVHPFGMPVKLFTAENSSGQSSVFAPVDGRVQMEADEGVTEINGTRIAGFGPFEQVTFRPTVQRGKRTKSVTVRHLGDLFFL